MGTPSEPESATSRRAAAIGLVLAAMLCGPAWFSGSLAGSPGAETMGHAWVQAWASEGWPAWPTGTVLAAGATSWPVIDPLPTWLIAGLSRVVGLTAAWNVLVATGIVLASLGGARLAKAWGGAPLFGAVAVPLMPIFLGSLTSGLTEDALLGLVAFALADAKEGRWLRAGLLVGITAWCGLYLAWMAGIGVAVLGLRSASGNDLARSWRPRLGGAVLALTLGFAAAAPFSGALQAGAAHRPPPAPTEPLWPLNPWHGADLASFLKPGKVELGDAQVREHPVYLGFATLGLAALGGTPGGWLAVLACAAVAPGDELRFAGTPLGVHNPAATLLHALPFGDHFRNHARLMLLGQLILVAMASRGAAKLTKRSAHAVAFASILVAAETVFVSPARAPLPATSTVKPAIYAELAAAPPGLPVRVVGTLNPQQPLFDQRAHGRVLRNDPNRPDPGRPRPEEEIVVGFGGAVPSLTRELGEPDAQADGAAAWWPDR